MVFDELPGAPRSLWLDGPEAAGLAAPALTSDLEVDACVVGGRIAGVTTALELARGGRSVVLLERDRVGAGVTGHSTAKLSSLQGSTYSELERHFGATAAAGYAELNEGAIGYVVDHVQTLGIDCDLRRRPHAVYAWTTEQAEELDRGLFFPRLTPKRSYCLAVRIPGPLPDIMAISIGSPTRSLRAAPDPGRPGEEMLVLGGEGHTAGEDGDHTPERYQALWSFAQDHFNATEATHRWSAHDMTTADGLPYAGRLTPLSRHVWVATGFRKWGLTNGTAAGQILAARILDREHPHRALFDTTRLTPRRSAVGIAQEGLKDARHLIGDRLKSPKGETADHLEPGGDGELLKLDGDLVAASRDEDGTLHTVSPVCTHLGCRVAWNRAERSWDCPCHGSRLAPDGRVLQGPAVQPLAQHDAGDGAGAAIARAEEA